MEIVDNRPKIRERTQKVFKEIFEDPTLVVSEQTKAEDIPKWDSLSHISLILALEEEFDVQFSSEEVTSMTCVGDLFAVLERRMKHGWV